MARLRKVLSTPKKTSPNGFDAPARMALLSAAPASPDFKIETLALLADSNCASTASLTANESCETTTSSVALDAGAVVGCVGTVGAVVGCGAIVGATVGALVGALVGRTAVGVAPAQAAKRMIVVKTRIEMKR